MAERWRFELLRDPAALSALAPAWRRLFERCPDATPFQSPEWLLPWWDAFREGKALVTVAGYRHGVLELLLPLCTIDGTVMFIGSGNSDHLDLLTTAAEALPGALAALEAAAWSAIELHQLPPHSPLLALPGEVGAGEPCPIASLPPPISVHFAKRLERSRRALSASGAVSFAHENTPDAFAHFAALHRQRWQTRGEAGVVDGGSGAFLLEVLQRSPEARLGVLRAGTAAVAAYLGFLHRGVLYSYLGGFDPAFERIGIGNLLIDEAMRAALHGGARAFDFLRGREAYKYRWGAADRPTRRWSRRRG